MTYPSLSYLGFCLPLLVTFQVDAFAAGSVKKETSIFGPTIITFAPPETEGQKNDSSIEGVAHTQYAMQDTAKCLRPKKVAFQFWFADRLVIRSGKTRIKFEVGQLGQGFGAVLIEPGRSAKVVHSEDGPSTLKWLLPHAAFEYWHAKECESVD